MKEKPTREEIEEYFSFKKAYEEAVKENKTQFKFEKRNILTSYAKYILEYLKDLYEPK
jgi:hypothetical protein